MRSEVQSLHVDMDARANFEVLHPEKTVESFLIFKGLGGWDKPYDRINQVSGQDTFLRCGERSKNFWEGIKWKTSQIVPNVFIIW